MIYKFIDNILASNNLSFLDLDVLNPDSHNYKTLLFQPKGKIEVTPLGFKNQNESEVIEKVDSFIKLAIQKNASLAITPEYFCPFESIKTILSNKSNQPAEKKLWILGCESITPIEIESLKREFTSKDCFIYYDESVLSNQGNFLDPVCYVFKARSTDSNLITVCLIQFKTQHMGVWESPFERDHYIKGNELYIFRNNLSSIYLLTLICSEATKFEIDNTFKEQIDHRWDNNPFIIINIQLNPKPAHEEFILFRGNTLKFEHKDLISLNWAKGTTIAFEKVKSTFKEYSRSGIYSQRNQLRFDNDRYFLENHIKGLYYTYKNPDLDYFHFNSENELFDVDNTKPYQGQRTPLTRRTGPNVISCYNWKDSAFQINEPDDELALFLEKRGYNNSVLLNADLNVFDKERLVCISTGNISNKGHDGWYRIDKLKSCMITHEESICRISFTQDSHGDLIRGDFIKKFETLNYLLNNQDFPERFSFLKDNSISLSFDSYYDESRYNYNIITKDKEKATGAFIGNTDLADAKKVFDKYIRLFNSEQSQSRKRVIIWYEHGIQNYENIYDRESPKITNDYSNDPASIKRDKL